MVHEIFRKRTFVSVGIALVLIEGFIWLGYLAHHSSAWWWECLYFVVAFLVSVTNAVGVSYIINAVLDWMN